MVWFLLGEGFVEKFVGVSLAGLMMGEAGAELGGADDAALGVGAQGVDADVFAALVVDATRVFEHRGN